jgi:GNAT superfamily N-acetyltransferase
MAVAGIFLARRNNDSELVVQLDYVVPEYRDYKNGRFLYNQLQPQLKAAGFTHIKAGERNPNNDRYFKKLGFEPDAEGFYRRRL